MSRLLRIAAREYTATVRTFGFWLSLCMMPLALLGAIYFTGVAARASAVPTLSIVDLTGGAYGPSLAAAVESAKPRPAAIVVPAPGGPYASSAEAVAGTRAYLAGDLKTPHGDLLDAVAIVRPGAGAPALDLWTRNINELALQGRLTDALSDAARHARLLGAGLSPDQIKALDTDEPRVTQYSPKSGTGKVSMRDRLPAVVGVGMGVMLWSLILTGAGFLLNSVIEEKQNRILEVLLTSASPQEIMGGKILGAAMVTATALCVWLGVGAFMLGSSNPSVLGDVVGILVNRGLLAYFALYFVGGYLMYATLFTTIGAYCETPREAQTLLGPLMILLMIPFIFMVQAAVRPESPQLQALSWFPPFTPFLMAARAAGEPPWWQVAGTAAMMFALTGLELWVAGRAFRTGALTSGRFDIRVFLAGVTGRAERA